MNVEYPNGLREKLSGLTAEQVAEETKKAIDRGASRIEIEANPNAKPEYYANRHERRKANAWGKKKGKNR